MTELLTAAQMRAIEQAAIDSGEVTGLELMERAGRGVVEAILDWRPELATTAHKAVILCGPGNNGGDGFVVARLLKQRGWQVEVFLYGPDPDDLAKLPPDAAENAQRWREMGEIQRFEIAVSRGPAVRLGDAEDIIVDALFGGGVNRRLPEDLRNFIHGTLANPGNVSKTVAVDIPTGLCPWSGEEMDTYDTTVAGLTVTFHRPRVGHFLARGPGLCGKIAVVDLGIDAIYAAAKRAPTNRNKVFRKAFNAHKQSSVRLGSFTEFNPRGRFHGSHKYHHGHALILSGGVGKGGAARLAARGALRVGAGLVTLGPPPAAIIENAAQLNAIMLRPVADADALAVTLKDDRITALCLGPGIGVGAHTLGLAAAALSAKRATVLDADVLTSFAEDPSKLFALLHDACILTPHMGEFARLFPDIAAKLAEPATERPAYSKVDAAREAAARAGCTILLKGPDTVIADPQGSVVINSAHYDRAAPWLATAGTGDVLAGMITGLLARGFAPMQAAETAAWLHVEAARKFGPGLIAEDLPEMLPAVFRDLGL